VSFLPLSEAGVPAVDPANEPATIRNGSPAAKQAYQVALSFEEVLVDQLTKQLAATTSDTDGSGGGDSSGDTSNGSTGLMGSGPAGSVYGSMIPQVLTSSIVSSGGLNKLAMQLATALDPSLASEQAVPSKHSTSGQSGPKQADPSGGAGL
jgi:hypothetical protein